MTAAAAQKARTANTKKGATGRGRGRSGGGEGGGGGGGQDPKEGMEGGYDALLIGALPHDWLFPFLRAVVHHGGAGTTAAGLCAGKPTMICPFFGDQHFWGHMVYQAGVGPEPCSIHEVGGEKRNVLCCAVVCCVVL